MSRTRIVGVALAGLVGLAVGTFESLGGRRLSRRMARALARSARYQSGRLDGLRYRLARRHPDPDVDDHVLADRVRSVLGPLERRLDLPHLHVQAQDHDVLLHGSVCSAQQAATIERAVAAVPGVREVRSHLRIGLLPGESRPSEGSRHRAPSEALTCLLAAAHGGGAPRGTERAAAKSVLSTFAALLPVGERRHVLAHFPADVLELADPPRSKWVVTRHPRRREEFALEALPTYSPERRQAVVESVLGAVRDLVPEEMDDVAAVLPAELRDLWKTAIPH